MTGATIGVRHALVMLAVVAALNLFAEGEPKMPTLNWMGREKATKSVKEVVMKILREDKSLSYGSGDNVLVHGDNLEALKALLPFYAGQVKCIYIDPPYNTGSAFEHYDDNLEHSTWLNMMYPRLKLLRDFMREDGSIWISIDDREGAYLRVICDEIFGRQNFVSNISWQRTYSTRNDAKGIVNEVEHILVYSKREGWQPSTIAMQRSSNLRFFRYLQDRKVDCFKGLTPDIIKDFNLQDRHKTPEGKAAYNCRIRSFLIFLYEQGLIEDPYLYRALPTAVSDRVSVVQTLSKEDVAAIWAVNPDELSPKALRDYAMVCIGLTMGFRASDIVSIRFSDIDWKQKSICVIQQKTGKALVLPMPVKTGNILFRYLRDGRPKSDEPFVFIRHKAPYGRLQHSVCTKALIRFIGSSTEPGRGFHVVRKTFATQLLEGSTKVELISDSLGHSTDGTVHKYLSLDEKRMRMCPLSLAEAGISYEGGAFHA